MSLQKDYSQRRGLYLLVCGCYDLNCVVSVAQFVLPKVKRLFLDGLVECSCRSVLLTETGLNIAPLTVLKRFG